MYICPYLIFGGIFWEIEEYRAISIYAFSPCPPKGVTEQLLIRKETNDLTPNAIDFRNTTKNDTHKYLIRSVPPLGGQEAKERRDKQSTIILHHLTFFKSSRTQAFMLFKKLRKVS